MSLVNLGIRILGFDDASVSSNPMLRTVDRQHEVPGLSLGRALTYPLELEAGEEVAVFDGTRATDLAADSELSIALSPLAADRYRLTWTGTGTAPAFRVDRAFGAGGNALTLTLQANGALVVTGTGPVYSNAQVGDQVLIRGEATGDAATVFDPLNVGYWSVIGVTGSSLTMTRQSGDTSGGVTETQTPAQDDDFIVFASSRVRPGDQMEIIAGFSTATQRTFTVLTSAPKWVDVQSSVPIASETATTDGVSFYSAARRMLYVETDQRLILRKNDDTGNTDVVEPLTKPNGERLGLAFKTGPVWKLVVANKAATMATALVVAWG